MVGLDIAGDESMGEIPAIKEHIMAFQVSCQNTKVFRNLRCIYSVRNQIGNCHLDKNFVLKILLQRAQELGISRTVHAGEAGPAASVHEVSNTYCTKRYSQANSYFSTRHLCFDHSILLNQVILCFYQAIFLLHANRVGHGYHVVGDPELYKYVIEKQVHLEVCKIHC